MHMPEYDARAREHSRNRKLWVADAGIDALSARNTSASAFAISRRLAGIQNLKTHGARWLTGQDVGSVVAGTAQCSGREKSGGTYWNLIRPQTKYWYSKTLLSKGANIDDSCRHDISDISCL